MGCPLLSLSSMFVYYIQKRGLFSEVRKVIQKVLRVLKNKSIIRKSEPRSAFRGSYKKGVLFPVFAFVLFCHYQRIWKLIWTFPMSFLGVVWGVQSRDSPKRGVNHSLEISENPDIKSWNLVHLSHKSLWEILYA